MPMLKSPSVARTAKRRITFRLDAPAAGQVWVSGTFCDWGNDCCPMKKGRSGVWTTAMTLAPGRYEYRFLVDGSWWDDPACAERVWNQFGSQNCVLIVR